MKNSPATLFLALGLFLSVAASYGNMGGGNHPGMPAGGDFAMRLGAALPGIVCLVIGITLLLKQYGGSTQTAKVLPVAVSRVAVHFAKQAFAARNYPPNAALRIVATADPDQPLTVHFDTATQNDRDLVEQIASVLVVVDKTLAQQMGPVVIDVVGAQFVCRRSPG